MDETTRTDEQHVLTELVSASTGVLTRLPTLVSHPGRTAEAERVLRRVSTQAVNALAGTSTRGAWLEFCADDLAELRRRSSGQPLAKDLELLGALVEVLRSEG